MLRNHQEAHMVKAAQALNPSHEPSSLPNRCGEGRILLTQIRHCLLPASSADIWKRASGKNNSGRGR